MANISGGTKTVHPQREGAPRYSPFYAEGAGKYARRFQPSNYFFASSHDSDYSDESDSDDESRNPGEHSLDFNRTQTGILLGEFSKNQGGRLAFWDDVWGLHFVDHLGNEFRWAPDQDDEPGEVIAGNPGKYDISYPVNWFMIPNEKQSKSQFFRRYPKETERSLHSKKYKDFEERHRQIVMTTFQPLEVGDLYGNYRTSAEARANYDYSGSRFSELNLSGTKWIRCGLRDVDFSDSNLSNSNFTESDLTNADLSGTDLEGADLSGANLSRVNFSGVDVKLIGNLDRVKNAPPIIQREIKERKKKVVELCSYLLHHTATGAHTPSAAGRRMERNKDCVDNLAEALGIDARGLQMMVMKKTRQGGGESKTSSSSFRFSRRRKKSNSRRKVRKKKRSPRRRK